MVYLTRPGLAEKDYITWKWKWTNIPANGLYSAINLDVLIDEKNGKLSMTYQDSSWKSRFGIYNISDFSAVYVSPAGSHYPRSWPDIADKTTLNFGLSYLDTGGLSQAIQTYLLLVRWDHYTIEVWRGGASALWSRSTRTDFGATCNCYTGGISLLGKYMLVVVRESASPNDYYLMLYEGE